MVGCATVRIGYKAVFTHMTNFLTTVATLSYWCTSNYKQTVWKMDLCLVVKCGCKSFLDKGLYFARVPSVVTNQGEEAQ